MSKVESRIEDGYLVTIENGFLNNRFQIVDEIPLGYDIWNIGEHMPEGWLPLCRLCEYQPFIGAMNIEPDTLKAIKCEGAQEIMKASIVGLDTLEKVEEFIEKYEGHTYKEYELKRAKAALPYMQKLKWN